MVKIDIDEPIHIEEYNPEWPRQYSEEADNLLKSLSSFQPELAHFGSTAVPGMPAKPIIDILIGIDVIPPHIEFVKKLISIGYEYLGEAGVKGRHYFRRRGSVNFNLAVVQKASVLWKENLAIRDYLRTHSEDVRAYGELKRAVIASGAKTLLDYSAGKAEFMLELLQKAHSKP